MDLEKGLYENEQALLLKEIFYNAIEVAERGEGRKELALVALRVKFDIVLYDIVKVMMLGGKEWGIETAIAEVDKEYDAVKHVDKITDRQGRLLSIKDVKNRLENLLNQKTKNG